jgi:hypothetical protein
MILKLWPLYDKDTADTISTQYVCSGKTWLVDFLFWVISISAILMIKLRFSSLRHMWPSHILAILLRPFGFIVPKFGVPIFRFWAYRSDEGYSRNVSCALNLISMFLLVTVTHIGKITLHYIQVERQIIYGAVTFLGNLWLLPKMISHSELLPVIPLHTWRQTFSTLAFMWLRKSELWGDVKHPNLTLLNSTWAELRVLFCSVFV